MALAKKKTSTTSSRSRNLLIELGTEELPPKALKKLGVSFADSIFQHLVEAGVANAGAENYQFYASPRRLVVWIKQVAPRQSDKIEERKGPSLKAAFDDAGNPTRAAQGFAGSCGVSVEQLEQQETDKGTWLIYRQKVTGEKIQALVEAALDEAIRKLPIPKRMRWGDREREFVRPVHWLLAMYGSDPLRVSVLDLKSDNWTMGHRFHAPGKIRVMSADRYLKTLKSEGFVIADYAERKALIEKQVLRQAARVDATAVISPELLDEVTGLVEWPQALYGQFDRKFLDVPAEVLVSSMRDHQKYFHLVDSAGNLLPGFITVSNIKSSSPKRVRSGNERVLRARLADAEFFWQGDQKIALIDRKPALDQVLFHKKLGSILDKVERIRALTSHIGNILGANADHVNRAVDLCKADLVTDMVAEVPELQGVIGRYYAANQGEAKAVCGAIEEHYLPKFAGDRLPKSDVSQSIALADRLDSLVGIFACGEVPTGDKDPYALRRAALGVLRIMIECKLELDLQGLISLSLNQFRSSSLDHLNTSETLGKQVFDFVMERLRAYYQPLGYDVASINSVLSVTPTSPADFDQRLQAVRNFISQQTEAAQSLAAANKRIANILAKQADGTTDIIDSALFSEKAEVALAAKLENIGGKAQANFAKGKYSSGLLQLARLKAPVDTFFDQVMVMDDDPKIRTNRLALLKSVRELFLAVADISHLRID